MLSRVTYSMEISLSYALLLASLLLPLLYLLFSLRKNPSNGHGRIPSPPAFPVIGHIHLLKKPLHRSLGALAARYGGGTGLLLLRFGHKRVLLVSSPAIAQESLTVHDVALADRPVLPSQRRLTENCPSTVTSNYGPFWRHLRRIATVHALSPHRLALTAAVRDGGARAMARKLWRAGPGAAVSVKSAAYELMVNVITAMVSGDRMPEDVMLRFKVLTEKGFAASGAANRHDFMPVLKLLDFGRMERRLAVLADERNEFGQRLVEDYRRLHHRVGAAEETEPRTTIGDLLRHQERSPESYNDVVIRTVCMDLMQAGTDTSSCTVEWAMALLLNHQAALAKVAAEIDAVVGTSRLLQDSDLASLPYLRCVVAETLRLYPLAPHLAPHEASRDCALAAGGGQYTIERGTMVLVDVFSMQRDPAAWEEPDSFVPERFFAGGAAADDKQVITATAVMMPFGMGRRRCPGEALAWRTIRLALGVLVQCFEWEHAGEVDMSEGSGLNMPMAVPLMATCRPRQEMVEVLKRL